MENQILISWINDFVFCPASIYFHGLYDSLNRLIYQDTPQLEGTKAHSAIEDGRYSTKKDVLQGIEVFCDKYNIMGKIDIFDLKTKTLTERKKTIKEIYDGYIFQLYAQYFCLTEMGFDIEKLQLYSMSDNKTYVIALPQDNSLIFTKFEETINEIRNFNIEKFTASNPKKCENCIYEPACDRSKKTI